MKVNPVTGLLVILIFLCGCRPVVGETTLSFSNMTRADGLPSNRVRCVFQDFTGFIWIGTDNGLARFDGSEMKVFTNDPKNPSSIIDNCINAFIQARDSLIWIATNEGLSVYNPRDGSFIGYPNYLEGPERFPQRGLTCMMIEADQSLWVGTETGIVHVLMNPVRFESFHIRKSNRKTDREFYFDFITCIIQDPDDKGKLLLATLGGLLQFDKIQHDISRDYKKLIGNNTGIIDLYLENDRRLWTCGWGIGLNCLDLETGKWQEYPFNPATPLSIVCITPKSADEFWLATIDHGLAVFSKQTGTFRFFTRDPSRERSIISNSLKEIACLNNNKDIWITSDEGISVLSGTKSSFQPVDIPFRDCSVNAFFRDMNEKKLFLGAIRGKGIYEWDEVRKTWSLILPDDPPGEDGITITGFYSDSRARLWVATRSNLHYYDPVARILKLYRAKNGQPLPLREAVVYGLMEDAGGNLWVGTRNEGVFCIDSSRQTFIHYMTDPSDPHSLIDGGRIRSFCQDQNMKIWIGTDNGISVFNPETGRFSNCFNDSLRSAGIIKRWVNGIEKDSLQRLWITLDGAGLLRVTETPSGNFIFKLFNTANGLNNPSIGTMVKDPNGGLWLINYGLLYVDPYREMIHLFNEHNGLSHPVTFEGSLYADPEGNIYMGGTGMYEIQNIRNIDFPPLAIRLILESIEVNGRNIPVDNSANPSTEIKLRGEHNNLLFRYCAICFHEVEQMRFRYKLEGFDQDWVIAGTGREARYANLSPGEYRFAFTVSNRGVWLDQEQSVKIRIRPFLWKTWWFISLAVCLTVAILFLIYRSHVRQLLKLERLRTRIASDLHDDLGSTLSSISIFSEILTGQTADPQSLKVVRTIGTHARNMLEKLDDIIWMVNPANDTFQNLGLRIREYAIPLLESKNISADILFGRNLSLQQLPMDLRRNLYLIVKEAVNNAVKYAECKTLTIRINLVHHSLFVEISDDGKGFDPAAQTTRNGLKNMRHRAEQIRGHLIIDSSPGKGTRVCLETGSV